MTVKRIETPCPVFSYRLSAIEYGVFRRGTVAHSRLLQGFVVEATALFDAR